MNIEHPGEIRRLAGGGIDYEHYSALGRQARSREFRAVMRSLLATSKRPARLLPVLAAIVSVLTF